jgi:hypothetical protein
MKKLTICPVLAAMLFLGYTLLLSGCQKDENPEDKEVPFKELLLKEFHINGKLSSRYYYNDDEPYPVRNELFDSNGDVYGINHRVYEEDRLIHLYRTDIYGNPTNIYYEYNYNEKGLLAETWRQRPLPLGETTFYLMNTFEYDNNLQLKRINRFSSSGNLSSSEVFEYIDSNTIKISFYCANNEYRGSYYEEYEESYDPFYRFSPKTSLKWPKNLKRTYSPIADENGTVHINLHGNSSTQRNMFTHTNTYNDNKFLTEQIVKFDNPNLNGLTYTFFYYD